MVIMVLHNRKELSNRKETNLKKHPENDKCNNVEENNSNVGWSCTKIIQNIFKCLFLIIVVPVFLNFAALVREEKELKPEGIFIDVRHGQKLYKGCFGTGVPTVIFDAPVGQTSDVWSLIVPAVAKLTKVCVYDRAGLGYSERVIKGINETNKSGKPHTVERMAEDFGRLFDSEEKPFILVGADLGATVAKFYTQLYQDMVVATILINPIFEGLFQGTDNPWAKYWFYSYMPSLQLQHISSALGITRLGLQTGLFQEPFPYSETPDVVSKRQKYLRCKPGHVSSVVEESYFINETLSQSRILHKIRPYPDNIPMTLIWTDKYSDKITDERNRIWLKSQEMFEKTLQVKPISKIRLYTSSPKLFFSHDKRIVEIVRRTVREWRKASKMKY